MHLEWESGCTTVTSAAPCRQRHSLLSSQEVPAATGGALPHLWSRLPTCSAHRFQSRPCSSSACSSPQGGFWVVSRVRSLMAAVYRHWHSPCAAPAPAAASEGAFV